jgi:hypothetical protein
MFDVGIEIFCKMFKGMFGVQRVVGVEANSMAMKNKPTGVIRDDCAS